MHAILNEHENAHGSPSTSPGASPAPSRPPSPPPSPHLKPNLPSGADPDDYMEDEQNSGFSPTQQMEMNINAAASADARASTGGEASPEEPTSSPPHSGVGETAAAPNQTSQSGAEETLFTNLSSFMKQDSFYELCGLLGTKDIERTEFDALCSKGLVEASGELGNLNDTLGKQAGAALALELDRIFHKKGMAILKECPMAAGWKGGVNSWGYCAPHPEYHILKRARLTTEGNAQPWNHEAWEDFSRNLLSHAGKSNDSGDGTAYA